MAVPLAEVEEVVMDLPPALWEEMVLMEAFVSFGAQVEHFRQQIRLMFKE